MGRYLSCLFAVVLLGCPESSDLSISVNPEALEFGVVPLGGDSTLTVTVRNGGEDATLTLATIVGSTAFTLQARDWPIDLAGGGELTLQVTFAPQEIGAAEAQLQIVPDLPPSAGGSSDPALVTTVALIGEGVTIPPGEDADGDGFISEADGGDDCDDGDPGIHPDADEVCNELDDNCDGEVDEGVDLLEFLPDVDGDGYGASEGAVLACEAPAGTVELEGDCDDADPLVNPAAIEVCDGVDNDCDGGVDEDLATSDWYPDGDADGFGELDATAIASCLQPPDTADDASDCDDGDDTIYPDAPEACDDADSDCDGSLVDGFDDFDGDLDPDCNDLDDDNDASLDPDDCDDLDAAIYPGAPEIEDDGVDQDCNGFDTVSCFADADDDGWGSGDVLSEDGDCDDLGETDSDGDCDDADGDVNPDAVEIHDGIDNDCDGGIDTGLHVGTGADGPLAVTGATDLSTTGLAPTWPVVAITDQTITADEPVVGLSPGDEVLIANLHGSDAEHAAVGTWEFASVASVLDADIELAGPLAQIFGEIDNTDLTDQAVLILRVPQFTDVTVAAGGLLTTSAWDGAVGGILAFRANGTVLVEDGGTIAVDSLGYWGGDTGPTFNCDSYQGESYAGVGEGPGNSGGCASYNEAWGYWVNNWGGGGAHITGGGGAYGPGATAGDSWTGGGATPPYAGIEYGDAELTGLYFGSGGGGVWNGQDGDPGEDPGPGGDGAGILLIGAAAMQADGAGALTAQGGSTVAWAWGNWTYGAGGGAGGAIFVVADDLTLAADAVDASGGFGQDDYTRDGGDGGVGRIRIDFGTLNGFPFASPDADAALADGALPDAGFSAAVPPP